MPQKRSLERFLYQGVDDMYNIDGPLGSGGMSSVVMATYKTNGRKVALKLGHTLKKKCLDDISREHSMRYHKIEWDIYQRLNPNGRARPGIPQAYEYGMVKLWAKVPGTEEEEEDREHFTAASLAPDGYPHNLTTSILQLRPYLSLQLLGPSLERLMEDHIHSGNFCSYAERMLTAVESFHASGFVHRDIKPGNFCVGPGSKGDDVYLVDYGFAKDFDPSKADPEVFHSQGEELYGGTPDYSSTNQLNCRTTGFHDDLESLGFAWLHMLTGDLPWDIIKALQNPSAPWSCDTVLKMAPVRVQVWAEAVQAGTIPNWLVEWQLECESHECNEVPNYAKLRHVLRRSVVQSIEE